MVQYILTFEALSDGDGFVGSILPVRTAFLVASVLVTSIVLLRVTLFHHPLLGRRGQGLLLSFAISIPPHAVTVRHAELHHLFLPLILLLVCEVGRIEIVLVRSRFVLVRTGGS